MDVALCALMRYLPSTTNRVVLIPARERSRAK